MSWLKTAHLYSGNIILLKQNIWCILCTDLADCLIAERVDNATGECDFINLLATNKDAMEVIEVTLIGYVNTILGSIIIIC